MARASKRPPQEASDVTARSSARDLVRAPVQSRPTTALVPSLANGWYRIGL
jgi:hypothetical protein